MVLLTCAGPLEVLLSQTPILVGLVCNRLLLRRPYHWTAWLGALLVLSSSVARMVSSQAEFSSWDVMFALGYAPLGVIAPVYEIAYDPTIRGSDARTITPSLQLLCTNAALSVWLLIFSPIFGVMPQGVNPWPQVRDGAPAVGCVAGWPQVQLASLHRAPQMPDAMACILGRQPQGTGDCPNAIAIFVPMIAIVALQLHSQALLSGHESGAWANLVTGASPFGADIIFPFLPGLYYQKVLAWDALGVALALIGLGVFVYGEKLGAATPARQRWRIRRDAVSCMRWLIAGSVPTREEVEDDMAGDSGKGAPAVEVTAGGVGSNGRGLGGTARHAEHAPLLLNGDPH